MPLLTRLTALALAVLGLTLLVACGVSDDRPRRRVILILLDAARPDRFGSYGYGRDTTPNMDRLAERGWVFTRHFSQATYTRQSLPSLLYSRYFAHPLFPSSANVPYSSPRDLFRRVDDEAISLPRAFAAAGFDTAAISSHFWLKPGTAFAGEFQEMNDLSVSVDYDRRYGHPRGDAVVDAALRWLDRHRHRDTFLYLHFMDTHFPHFFGPEARRFFGEDRYDARTFDGRGSPIDRSQPLSASDRAYLDALYDGSLRYTDEQIGRLISFLEQRGQLDDTLIAITSDHGDHLLEVPGRFAHGGPWYDAVAKIPLIVFYPPKTTVTHVDTLSDGVDVLPTLLGLMDVPVPAGKKPDGVDLGAIANGVAPAKDFALAPRAIRDGGYKVLFRAPPADLLGGSGPGVEELPGELYDLAADPLERQNLWASEPETARRLLASYRRQMRGRYRRSLAATTREQPASAFAISATYFLRDSELPSVPVGSANEMTFAELAPAGGWVRITHHDLPWLVAKPDAEPIEIELAVPDGTYFVTAHLRGRGAVIAGGSERRAEARGPQFRLDDLRSTAPVELGEVKIEDERFRAVIEPSAGAWLGVRFIAFEPILGGQRPQADEEDLERLKTLGYVD